MIKSNIPLSMIESSEYLKKDKESNSELKGFMKKFTKLKIKEAKELRKEIEGLNLMKINPEQISKIIDLMPDNAENLNKIFVDVGLNEDEIKKILEIIKKFK